MINPDCLPVRSAAVCRAVAAVLAATSFPVWAGPPAGEGSAVPPPAPPSPTNPLSFAGGRVVFSLENQARVEMRENTFDFDSGVDSLTDDAFFLNRFRIGLLLTPADWIAFQVQGQDSREVWSERPDIPGRLGAEGDNPFDLRQAFVTLGDGGRSFPLTLKAGRQALAFGDQRLIGPLEWNNIARSFDGASLRWHGGERLWVEGFVSSLVVIDPDRFDESDWDSVFSGVYASVPVLDWQDTEFYVLHLDDDDRDDAFFTFGTHWKSRAGALDPWDYEAGFAYQAGDAAGRDLSAFAAYVQGGFTFDHAWKPRIGAEYSFGSGDGDAADGDEGSFQNLFPTNHLYYGFMDLFSWSNLHDVVLHLSAQPAKSVTVGLDFHVFWLADTADAWRRANGRTAVRPIDPSAGNFAGTELDLLVKWSPHRSLSLTAGYSHFFAGDYLEDTGASSDADFGYVMASLKF